MASRKYSSFADLESLEKEKEQILAIYAEVKNGVLELSKLGIKINTAGSVKQVEDLTDSFDQQDKVLAKQQKTLVDMANKLASLTTEQAKQIEAVRQVTNLTKGLNTESEKTNVLRQGEYESLVQNRIANTELNKSIQLRVKLRNAEQGSEEQLNLLYQKSTKILSQLSDTQRGSDRGQALEKFAADTKKNLDLIQQRVGNFRGNVGNYANSLVSGFQMVSNEIARLTSKADTLEKGGDPAGRSQAVQLRKDISDLDDVLKISYNTNQSYTKTVRQIEKAYQDLSVKGTASTEFLQNFEHFAAESKKQAKELKEQIGALSSETRGLDLATESISALASGFEAFSGVVALTGADTKDIEKSIQRLVAVQSVANGVREVAEQITKKGTAANKAYNFVIQQGSTLFGKGATAAQRFGAALKSIIVLAVIGFIIEFIQSLKDIDDGAEGAQKSLEKLNKEIQHNKDILADLDKDSAQTFKGQFDALKTSNIERQKLAKDELDKQKILTENKRTEFELELKYKSDNIKELQRRADIANDDEVREEQKQNFRRRSLAAQGIKFVSKERAEADAASLEAVRKNADEAKKNLQEGLRDRLNFQSEYNQDVAKQDVEEFERRKKLIKEDQKAELELFKFRQGLVRDQNIELSTDESDNPTKFKIQAQKAASAAIIAITERQRKFDLDQENLTNHQRVLINEKADNEILDEKIHLSIRLTQIRINDATKAKQEADDFAHQIEEGDKQRGESIIANAQRKFDKEQAVAENFYNEDLASNADRFQKGEILESKYNARKIEIERAYQKAVLESQINFYTAQLVLLAENGGDVTAALTKLAELKKQLSELGAGFKIEDITAQKAALQELEDKYVDLAKTIEETVVTVIDGAYDAQKNKIQDQIDAINTLRDAQVDAAGKTVDSEEKKAARIAIINATAQAKTDALQRRQAQIDRQKAVFDRAGRVFEIVLDGIVAVQKIKLAALAAINPVIKVAILAQIPISIATTAAALIATLATPIPKYYTGTESSEEGPAHTAERGREMAITPDGQLQMFDKPGTRYLKKGTKIYSNRVTEDMIRSYNYDFSKANHIVVDFPENRDDDIVDELRKMNKKYGMVIMNQFGIESTAWYQNNMKR